MLLTPLLGCFSGDGPISLKAPVHYGFVYVTNEADNTVNEYSPKADGSLQLIGSVPTGRRPGGILATDTTGGTTGDYDAGLVYVLNRDDNTISQYLIQNSSSLKEPSGTLIPADIPTIPTGRNPSAISSDGKLIYVTCEGDNSVVTYSIQDNGTTLSTKSTLVKVDTVATGPAPVDISGGYVVNSGNGTVSLYNPYGGIVSGQSQRFAYQLIPNTPSVLPVPGATRVSQTTTSSPILFYPYYVISNTTNTIQTFNDVKDVYSPQVQAVIPTIVQEPPLATGAKPSAVIADAFGEVYVANFADNTISNYKAVHTTGARDNQELVLQPNSQHFVTGKGPYDLAEGTAFDKNYIYCLNRTDQTIEVFNFNLLTSALNFTAVSTTPTGNKPARIATFLGNGKFAPLSTGTISVPIK